MGYNQGMAAEFVAPLAGAWIETVMLALGAGSTGSRAPRGRVD